MTLLSLLWLKQIGVADKYVQQNEPDQETAFQKAFTIELAMSLAFLVLVVVALPLYAFAYATPKIIVPGLVLSLAVPLTAFESPIWIPYRRMQFVRQRTLGKRDRSRDLVRGHGRAGGRGRGLLVAGDRHRAGQLHGRRGGDRHLSPTACACATTAGRCASTWVSWPLMALSLANLAVVQGSLIVSNRVVGLAGIGVIGLASSIASFADGVDGIISQTLYPAVCAVADRRDKLFEAFIRVEPARADVGGAVRRRPCPVRAGPRPLPARRTLGPGDRDDRSLRPDGGVEQVGFNYSIFLRAVNDTKPIMRVWLANLACFAVAGVPLILWLGLTGYALAFAAMTAVQIGARAHYLSRMFRGFKLTRHLIRAMAPSVPAAAIVLGLRTAVHLPQELPVALGELALYVAATLAATAWFEGPLVRELLGYLRRGRRLVPARAA